MAVGQSTLTIKRAPDPLPDCAIRRHYWFESNPCLLVVRRDENFINNFYAIGRLIKSEHQPPTWQIEGCQGDWHDRVLSWAELPPIGHGVLR